MTNYLYNKPTRFKNQKQPKCISYSKKQVLSSEYDYQIKRFHKGDLSFYRIGQLTVIRKVFKKPIMEQHYENQHQNWIYFKNNIKERAEISVDNWLMELNLKRKHKRIYLCKINLTVFIRENDCE